MLQDAGFRDEEVRKVEASIRPESASERVRFERESFGALHQMLDSLDETERDSVWEAIEQAKLELEGPEGFVGPCEMVLAAGTKWAAGSRQSVEPPQPPRASADRARFDGVSR